MSHQLFLFSPKFNKVKSPTNKYQEFSSIMVKTGNGTPNRTDVYRDSAQEWNKIKKKAQ